MSRSPEADADIRQIAADLRAADAAEEAAPPPTLLQAGAAVAAVMRYGGQSFAIAADRLERLDSQPYPITYVIMSNHVVSFLRALDRAQNAPPEPPAEPAATTVVAGPPLRESGRWAR
jgi:plasmid stabilization system protein ParE